MVRNTRFRASSRSLRSHESRRVNTRAKFSARSIGRLRSRAVEFLAFGKIVSLQSDTAAEPTAGVKSEPREYFSLPLPSSFSLARVRLRPFSLAGTQFPLFKESQKKFLADRNGETKYVFRSCFDHLRGENADGKRKETEKLMAKNMYEVRALSVRFSSSLCILFLPVSFSLQRCKPANPMRVSASPSRALKKSARLEYEAPFVLSVNCRD